MKALVRCKLLLLDRDSLVSFTSKWICPVSCLSVRTRMHMCVHFGILQDGKCSGNVKYCNYVQRAFLFLLCSQLGKWSLVSGQSHI